MREDGCSVYSEVGVSKIGPTGNGAKFALAEINLSRNRENAQLPRFRQRGRYISSQGMFGSVTVDTPSFFQRKSRENARMNQFPEGYMLRGKDSETQERRGKKKRLSAFVLIGLVRQARERQIKREWGSAVSRGSMFQKGTRVGIWNTVEHSGNMVAHVGTRACLSPRFMPHQRAGAGKMNFCHARFSSFREENNIDSPRKTRAIGIL